MEVVLAVVLAGISVVGASNPRYTYSFTPPYTSPTLFKVPIQYNYDFAVSDRASSTHLGHQETRNGYDTKGSYSVLLPDGRVQQVTYTVNGDSGYVAEVTYYGDARYPAYQPGYRSLSVYNPITGYKPIPAYRHVPAFPKHSSLQSPYYV
ncbi:cuticle protein 7 [Procambarus clarkii]|uniref:cuticle protein 7 n=1 Tax=Procambarus clarkii TaxID=6728 RepID=UPI001E676AD3|nr:cuticle protein 7-like [Procambarus clarkii]